MERYTVFMDWNNADFPQFNRFSVNAIKIPIKLFFMELGKLILKFI